MAHKFLLADLLIDDTDRPVLGQYCWYVTPNGYVGAMTVRDGKRTLLLLHRFLLGEPPARHVDHINGDTRDNRRANLRVATYTQNQVNRHHLNKNNRTGARGIEYVAHLDRWHARLTVNRRTIRLGSYPTRAQAINARRDAELEYYGELCPLPANEGW